MGIKNGAPDIITIIRTGLYNKHAKHYKIIVDGELMRYKGMIENNLNKHNAEEAIAALSFDYMKNLIDHIELFIGRRSAEVVVFMDGCRVFNKESGRADFRFDARFIRVAFKHLCYTYGYTVNELTHGESELQMYLQRDKTMDLNVFLTNDSDMISICYGHKPTLSYILPKEDMQPSSSSPLLDLSSITEIQTINVTTNTTHPIIDQNKIYDLQKVKVVDSCIWINCGKIVTAVGFDFIESRMNFNTFTFRTFISFCGTDYTSNLLTDSMVTGILLSEKVDIEYINTLTDIHDIACCLIMLGLRAGGTIKRFDEKAKSQIFNAADVDTSTRMYLEYIESGKMKNEAIPRPCMSLACRHYLYAMKGQDSCFVKKSLNQWAKSTLLSDGVEQMRQYLGTFDPMLYVEKIPNRKRKTSTISDKCDKLRKLVVFDDNTLNNVHNYNNYDINTSASYLPLESSYVHGSVFEEI